jgi:hypothetical protein
VSVSPSALGLGVGILILTSFISLLAFKLASRRAH